MKTLNWRWLWLTLSCALVIARRGETTHSGVDVNNTHLSMINPLNNAHVYWYIPYTHMHYTLKFTKLSNMYYIFFGHNIEAFLWPRYSTFDPALHLRRLCLPEKSRKYIRYIIHVLQRFMFHQFSKLFDIQVCVWWKTRHQILWIKAIFASCYNAIWYIVAYCCKEKRFV